MSVTNKGMILDHVTIVEHWNQNKVIPESSKSSFSKSGEVEKVTFTEPLSYHIKTQILQNNGKPKIVKRTVLNWIQMLINYLYPNCYLNLDTSPNIKYLAPVHNNWLIVIIALLIDIANNHGAVNRSR